MKKKKDGEMSAPEGAVRRPVSVAPEHDGGDGKPRRGAAAEARILVEVAALDESAKPEHHRPTMLGFRQTQCVCFVHMAAHSY